MCRRNILCNYKKYLPGEHKQLITTFHNKAKHKHLHLILNRWQFPHYYSPRKPRYKYFKVFCTIKASIITLLFFLEWVWRRKNPGAITFSPVQQKNGSQLFSLFHIATSLTEYLEPDMKTQQRSFLQVSLPRGFNFLGLKFTTVSRFSRWTSGACNCWFGVRKKHPFLC